MAAAEPLFRFAQINDLHMPGPALEAADEQASERGERARWLVNALHGESSSSESRLPPLDLILGVGDFVQGDDAESASTELDLFASMMRARQVPFYPVVGNHDYEAGNAEAERRFLEACGQSAPSYSFEHRGMAFIMLDNRPLSSPESNSQRIEWLRTTLEQHDLPKIVCCHIPLIPLRNQRSMERAGVEGFSPGVVEMLEVVEDHSDSLLAVLSGHLHLSGFRCTRSIFHICIAGTASFPCDFALYSVYADRIEVEVRQLPLTLLPEPANSGYSSEKLGTDLVDGDHATNIEFIMGTYDERRFVISMK